ncbi:glycosyltransferase [Paraburkholderia sp. LEh10]|uniref:TcdA/TcdB catalytic glycosyltransferase domain-containing protein n=1 Tax=Paraburkholderia sp. LEh10 TaxID=2821353 RepID=UPI001AE2CB0D|nr:TcdA/TcdB catalytic glycosyltransferase domain-containing protein [Paraburkholderia sp. LEh10]MBP0594791.1 glycosyltransferase [Paraburkholderia sp. LEh10]
MRAIPKVVHVIWIGGDIPQRNRDCIVTFPRMNPDWEVNLWIDANQLLTGERRRQISAQNNANVSAQQWSEVAGRLGADGGDSATIRYLDKYLNMRGEALQGLRVKHINSIMDFCKAHKLKLREVQRDLKMGKNSAIYRMELVNRGANFGSASDILRVEILLQYGGIYVDTDVSCVSPLGEIICHQSYPRFSAVNFAWRNGVGESDWLNPVWWANNITGDEPPPISNSIIAGHVGSRGLKSYKSLIHSKFKSLKTSDDLRTEYMNDFRGSTIRMTGPTAAAESSGFNAIRNRMFMEQARSEASDQKLQNRLFMRDNWYFPMHKVRDSYFHDWL